MSTTANEVRVANDGSSTIVERSLQQSARIIGVETDILGRLPFEKVVFSSARDGTVNENGSLKGLFPFKLLVGTIYTLEN